jgi:hypothetical protein
MCLGTAPESGMSEAPEYVPTPIVATRPAGRLRSRARSKQMGHRPVAHAVSPSTDRIFPQRRRRTPMT